MMVGKKSLYSQSLLLLSLSVLCCSSDAAFRFPFSKLFPPIPSGLRQIDSFIAKHPTRSEDDRLNHSSSFDESYRQQTAQRSRSDAVEIVMTIPNAGDSANTDATGVDASNTTCNAKREESGFEVNATLHLHLYLAVMYECVRNPSLKPLVLPIVLRQVVSLKGNLLRFLVAAGLFIHFPPLAAETVSLRMEVVFLVALTAIEMAITWIYVKRLDMENVSLLVPTLLSVFLIKSK